MKYNLTEEFTVITLPTATSGVFVVMFDNGEEKGYWIPPIGDYEILDGTGLALAVNQSMQIGKRYRAQLKENGRSVINLQNMEKVIMTPEQELEMKHGWKGFSEPLPTVLSQELELRHINGKQVILGVKGQFKQLTYVTKNNCCADLTIGGVYNFTITNDFITEAAVTPALTTPPMGEWDGKGLPPVGTKCLMFALQLPDGGSPVGVEVTIAGYFGSETWVIFANGSSNIQPDGSCYFESLSSVEDKLVEEMVEMSGDFPINYDVCDLPRELCERLIKAGYRKVE